MNSPSLTTSYTLTIAAPEDDDWLMALPITPPSSPDRGQSPSANDISHQSVTVGEGAPSLWESLRSPSPLKKRRGCPPGTRKARIKNAGSAFEVVSPPGGVKGVALSSIGNDTRRAADNHRPMGVLGGLNNLHSRQPSSPPITSVLPPSGGKAVPVATPTQNSLPPDHPLLTAAPEISVDTAGSGGGSVVAMEMAGSGTDSTSVAHKGVVAATEGTASGSTVASGSPVKSTTTSGVVLEDDILTSAMSATLFASTSPNTSGSANIITALTSTDFPNVIWTNSELDSGNTGGVAGVPSGTVEGGVSRSGTVGSVGSDILVNSDSAVSAITGSPADHLTNQQQGLANAMATPITSYFSKAASLLTTPTTTATPENSAYLTSMLTTPTTATPTNSDDSMLTLVSINSQLYLCNVNNATPTSLQPVPASALSLFPNATAINDFKIPKRTLPAAKRPPKQHPTSVARKGPVRRAPRSRGALVMGGESSERAVGGSVCLQRKRCGLAATPHTLSYTISTAAGRKWKSHDLNGEWEGE